MGTIDTFAFLVDLIHRAALDPGQWDAVVKGIVDRLGANAGGIIAGPARQVPTIVSATEADPAAVGSYNAYYAALDPVTPRAMAMPAGTVLTRQMVLPRAEMARSEFYNDWARPQGFDTCIVAKILAGPTEGIACLTLPHERMLPEVIEMMTLLAPHLRVAVETRSLLKGLALQRDSAMEVLSGLGQAVLFVDGASRVLYANTAAEALQRGNDGLTVGGGGLAAASAARTLELRRLIARAAGRLGPYRQGGSIRLPRPSGKEALVATVSPILAEYSAAIPLAGPEAVVLVTEPKRVTPATAGLLCDLFGLTHAEAAVALGIASGRGVKGTAGDLGVAPSTVRTHLHRVFAKTSTRRQAEVAHLVGQLVAPARREPD